MAVISRVWILAIALFPAVGIAQTTNWFPAVRASRPATAQGAFETVEQSLRAGLILWVPAATSQTSAASDYSTNATPFDLTNSAAGRLPSWVTNGGGSWAFGATQFWTTATAAPSSLATQGTFSVWMCMTQGGGNVQFLLNSSDNNGVGMHAWTMRVSASNTASFVTGASGVGNVATESAFVFATNADYNFTATLSNGNVRLFVNGVLIHSVSNTSWGSRGATNFFVGDSAQTGAQRPFRGRMDNVQVWSRALSSNEILNLVYGPTNFGQRRAHGL